MSTEAEILCSLFCLILTPFTSDRYSSQDSVLQGASKMEEGEDTSGGGGEEK